MLVVRSTDELIRDIQGSITREKGRLGYLKRCKQGLETWRESKAQLEKELARQEGKIQAYEDSLEMAKALQHHLKK